MPLFPFYWKANSGLMMPISLLKSRVIGARPGIYTQACLNSRHRDSPHLRDLKKKKKRGNDSRSRRWSRWFFKILLKCIFHWKQNVSDKTNLCFFKFHISAIFFCLFQYFQRYCKNLGCSVHFAPLEHFKELQANWTSVLDPFLGDICHSHMLPSNVQYMIRRIPAIDRKRTNCIWICSFLNLTVHFCVYVEQHQSYALPILDFI